MGGAATGCLLFAYFLLDKVATRILRSRDIRTSLYSTRKYADRGSGPQVYLLHSMKSRGARSTHPRHRKPHTHLLHPLRGVEEKTLVVRVPQRPNHRARDEFHLRFAHSARCARGRTQADTARPQRWARVVGDHLFVRRDADAVEHFFGAFAVETEARDGVDD